MKDIYNKNSMILFQVVGPFYYKMAFTNNDILKNIVRLSSSIWGEVILSETGFHVQDLSKT